MELVVQEAVAIVTLWVLLVQPIKVMLARMVELVRVAVEVGPEVQLKEMDVVDLGLLLI